LKVKNTKSSNLTFLNFTFHYILDGNIPVPKIYFKTLYDLWLILESKFAKMRGDKKLSNALNFAFSRIYSLKSTVSRRRFKLIFLEPECYRQEYSEK
jgi:hypothetical protein